MKKKLLLIVITSVTLTIIIYYLTINNKYTYIALGDGVASGMTSYGVNGYSFNDYNKDLLKNKQKLQMFYNYSQNNLTVPELISWLDSNYEKCINGNNVPIKQGLKRANIIVIAIGQDQINNLAKQKKLTKKALEEYYSMMNALFKNIKKINKNKVVVVGLYDTKYLKKTTEINHNVNKLVQNYNYIFVDISTIKNNNDYFFSDDQYYLNYKGHKRISELITKQLYWS